MHRHLQDGVASAAVLVHLRVPHCPAQVSLAHLHKSSHALQVRHLALMTQRTADKVIKLMQPSTVSMQGSLQSAREQEVIAT